MKMIRINRSYDLPKVKSSNLLEASGDLPGPGACALFQKFCSFICGDGDDGGGDVKPGLLVPSLKNMLIKTKKSLTLSWHMARREIIISLKCCFIIEPLPCSIMRI